MSDRALAEILGLTAKIVSAHVSKNRLDPGALPSVINSVYQSLATIDGKAEPAVTAQKPAVPWKKSVFPDYIICLEDGKKLKMLKRHLETSFNLTPHAYREKWGLPIDYPMVAPTYASKRSELAKKIGLGTHRSEPEGGPPVTQIPARRARGSR